MALNKFTYNSVPTSELHNNQFMVFFVLIIIEYSRLLIPKFEKWLQICPSIRRLTCHAVEFVNGQTENFDAIILATGYKSNVPSWLQVYFRVYLFSRWIKNIYPLVLNN